MASIWSGLLNGGRSLPVSACCFNVLPALLLLRVLDVFVGPLGHFATPCSNFVNNRSCLSPRLHLTSGFTVLGLQREMHEQLLYLCTRFVRALRALPRDPEGFYNEILRN